MRLSLIIGLLTIMSIVLVSGCATSAQMSSHFVSVQDLAMHPNDPAYLPKNFSYIVTEGFIDKDPPFVGNSYAIYSRDAAYKVRVSGNVPPATSRSCGILSYPYYAVQGNLIGNVYAEGIVWEINVTNYTSLECVKIEAVQQNR